MGNPNYKDIAISLSIKEFTLISLGGLTLFGFGIHYIINFIRKKRKK